MYQCITRVIAPDSGRISTVLKLGKLIVDDEWIT